MSRRLDRAGYGEPLRLDLLESDADAIQAQLAQVTQQAAEQYGKFQAAIHDDVSELRKTVVGVQRILVGILVSLTTAAILLALNIGVGR